MSLGSLDPTAFDHALKTLYSDAKVLSLIYKDNPFLAKVAKKTNFKGRNKVLDVLYAPGGGIGAGFATQQTNAAPASGASFTMTRSSVYAVRHIDSETIEASEGNEAALLDALKCEGDSAIQQLNNLLGMACFGDGSGQIGTIDITAAEPITGAVMKLEDPEDVVNFYIDQVLVFAADTASALRDSGSTLAVTGRDEILGTVTLSGNMNTISGLADGDAVFTEGNYTQANDKRLLVGVPGWIPATAPSAPDTFFSNTSRPNDPNRLAGYRANDTDYSGYSTDQAIRLLARYIGRGGFSPDTAIMSHKRMDDLITALGSKVQYNKISVPIKNAKGKLMASVGFQAVEVHTPAGVVECMADRSCGDKELYVLSMPTWELWTLGNTVKWISNVLGGGRTRTRESADGVELRLVSRGNLTCKAPGANGRFDWA